MVAADEVGYSVQVPAVGRGTADQCGSTAAADAAAAVGCIGLHMAGERRQAGPLAVLSSTGWEVDGAGGGGHEGGGECTQSSEAPRGRG